MKKWLVLLALCMSVTVQSEDVEWYEVAHVGESDTLNVRKGAGISHEVAFELHPKARQIKITGTEKINGSTWANIDWHGEKGWVNHYFLQKQATDTRSTLACSGTEPFWSVTSTADTSKVDILGKDPFSVAVSYWGRPHNSLETTKVISASDQQHSVVLMAEQAVCDDGMSDRLYGFKVMALIDNKDSYSGCCIMR